MGSQARKGKANMTKSYDSMASRMRRNIFNKQLLQCEVRKNNTVTLNPHSWNIFRASSLFSVSSDAWMMKSLHWSRGVRDYKSTKICTTLFLSCQMGVITKV